MQLIFIKLKYWGKKKSVLPKFHCLPPDNCVPLVEKHRLKNLEIYYQVCNSQLHLHIHFMPSHPI